MDKLQSIQDLFGSTLRRLTSGEWPAFLKTAAWTFKYSFPDQLLIYAQRPDATACASIEIWNKRLGRTVNADAAHIALIDDRGEEIRLHYVVDVSDTEGPAEIPLWRLAAQNQEYVYTNLAAAFNVAAARAGENRTQFFERIARAAVEQQMPQASVALQKIQSSCEGLRRIHFTAAETMLREFLVASVTATMMYRCDLVPEFAEPSDSLYGNIGLFSDPRALSILGQTMQSVSRDALLVAAKAAMDYDRTHKEEIHNEHSVPKSRGVSDPSVDHGTLGAVEPVRQTAEEIPARGEAQRVHGNDADRTADSAPEAAEPERTGNVPAGDEHTGGNQPGAEQSTEHSGVDSAHGEAAPAGGGIGSGEPGVRLTEEELPDATEYGIRTEFPSHEEQEAAVASSAGMLNIPQEEIDQVLTSSFDNQLDLAAIRAFFAGIPDSDEAAEFLLESYTDLDSSVIMPDGRYISVQALDSGLFLVSDDSRGIVDWPTTAARIRQLIDQDRYPRPAEKEEKLPANSAELVEGQTFTLAGVRYLVAGIGPEQILLQDVDHPIFTNPMSRSVLDILFKNEAGTTMQPAPVQELSANTEPFDQTSEEPTEEYVPEASEPALSEPEVPSGTPEQNNYHFLVQYAPEVMNGTLDYIRFESDVYEPLYIERIADDTIAIAHTFTQNGDLMYDPEMVFLVDEEKKELHPLSYEQSDMQVYQRVSYSEDRTCENPKLARQLSEFFGTWSQNLRWQGHTPVRGVKNRDSGELEYTFGDNRQLIAHNEEQEKAVAIETPSERSGLSNATGLYVGDVISFGSDDFVITNIDQPSGLAYSVSEKDGSAGVPMKIEQILAQIEGGGTTRLIHFWERQGYHTDRQDQFVLSRLLNLFETWRTSRGVYTPGTLYAAVMERMRKLYVSEDEAENLRFIRQAASEIRRWFPENDALPSRSSNTQYVLGLAKAYVHDDPSFEHMGNIERLPQWREGDEQRLHDDLLNLLQGPYSIYADKITTIPKGTYYKTSELAAKTVAMAEYVMAHKPSDPGRTAEQDVFYESTVRSARHYLNDLSALYPVPLGRIEPQALYVGDIYSRNEGERWKVYDITDGKVTMYSLETGVVGEIVDVDTLLSSVRRDPGAKLEHFWTLPETEALNIPELVSESPKTGSEQLFHVGDYYEDDYGKGVIKEIFPAQYDGNHKAVFTYVDPNATPGSRASKGYAMDLEAAAARVLSGEAMLIPAAEYTPPAPDVEPEELTLFDFVNDAPAAEPAPPKPVTVHAVPDASGRLNHRIDVEGENYGGPKARFRNNIAAIRLLKTLEQEDRLATEEEQQILSRYVGWGGLPHAFEPDNVQWAAEYEELKGLLTDEEFASARESTMTAFYTPPAVTEAIYMALDNFGFRRGNILDPCCGTGNFFGMLPDQMAQSKLYGVELDSLSGRIARQLYQQANILIEGYEKTNLPDSFYDVAVGNVPFGSYKLHDRRYDKENFLIHDYFFAKTLDKVRPGGIVAFVTSKGTMDKANDSVRRYISQRADLLGAIRLPDNTFKENAGTEPVADILFLKKRSSPRVEEADWVGLAKHYDYKTETWGPDINQYFVSHPEMILGDLKEVSGPHGPVWTCAAREGEDLREALHKAVSRISGDIDISMDELEEAEETRYSIPADPNVRNYSYCLVDGDIYFREDSQMYYMQLNKMAEKRIKGMIGLRDITRQLIDAQLQDDSDERIMALQKQLNDAYDTFTKTYGTINSRANSNAFSDDSSYFLLCSLEHIDDEGNFLGKADIFYKRTVGKHTQITHTNTAREALAVSMGEKGKVDIPFISELCGLHEDEILSDLKGLIFPVPGREGEYEISSTYLSGNVREKLAVAQEAAKEDPRYAVNAEYLENAIPVPLEPEDISVRLGATWIPQEDVTTFMQELFDFSYYKDYIKAVYEPAADSWFITNKTWDSRPIITSTYGTGRVSAYKLLEDALNQKNTQVFDTVDGPDGKQRRVLNPEETIAARDKQELIKEKFKEWIWSDPDRSQRLCKLYNEKFNSIVPPEFDESMVIFHGINPHIKLEKHQKESIARILYSGNTQLAHEVGAGKTWTMVAAAMEAKHLGLCNKSLVVVPNHLVGQWAAAIYDLYPSANVLASTKKDFETKNRKKFCSRIATGDYDIVVIGHSQFERIPLSAERQEATLKEQISDITDSISEMESNNAESFSIKQMERMKKSLTTKLEKLQDGKRRDDVVTFEELGVDRLFVDESHEFKNLFLYTKMHNVAGISQTDSQKASDLFMKCRYIDEITGNMGNIHATGTPLSNTMAELYTTQRYLQYDLLQSMGLGSFDAWASTFGETVQSIELAPEGTGYRERTRFANFFNIPELIAIYKLVADVRTADMLNLPVPEAEYHVNVVPASEEQKAAVQELAKRADDIRQRRVNNKQDNMLCITNDGRKLALDQRLLDPTLPDNPNSKAHSCVKDIMKYYREGEEEKLTQLVFCDLSTPTGSDFNVYQDLKDKLMAEGIPEDEIHFIHEANSDAQKEALFARVRSGAVRVLMGSTTKMGTGTNVQDRLIAGHDLDCPWRPSDLKQRAGRVIRRGNRNKKVHIHRYVTENTFDAYLYQLIEAKQRFSSQIFTSKSPVRVAADVDESVLDYSQIKALASGNPKVREKIELEIELARLKTVENNYKREQRHLEFLIRTLPEDMDKLKKRISGYEEDKKLVESTPSRTEKGELIPADVQGKTYESQADTGKAIFQAIKKLPETDKWFCIGHLRGFKILAWQSEQKTTHLAISGARSYPVGYGDDPVGLMIRLNNVLDSTIEANIRTCRKELSVLERDYESAKTEYGKPFTAAETIKAKKERLRELELELNLDKQESLKETESLDTEAPEASEISSLADRIADAQRRSEAQRPSEKTGYQYQRA